MKSQKLIYAASLLILVIGVVLYALQARRSSIVADNQLVFSVIIEPSKERLKEALKDYSHSMYHHFREETADNPIIMRSFYTNLRIENRSSRPMTFSKVS